LGCVGRVVVDAGEAVGHDLGCGFGGGFGGLLSLGGCSAYDEVVLGFGG
jgi:hypothetical protein